MSSDFATPPGLRHRQIAVRDTTLHVAEVGSGTPVLLLHGWPEFWATWLPLMNRLHGGFRLIAPDLRGFGDSAKAAPPAAMSAPTAMPTTWRRSSSRSASTRWAWSVTTSAPMRPRRWRGAIPARRAAALLQLPDPEHRRALGP